MHDEATRHQIQVWPAEQPGGLSTAQVLSILEELADLRFVGMDCVEVAPPYDHAELTSQAIAASTATHFINAGATLTLDDTGTHFPDRLSDDDGTVTRRTVNLIRPPFGNKRDVPFMMRSTP